MFGPRTKGTNTEEGSEQRAKRSYRSRKGGAFDWKGGKGRVHFSAQVVRDNQGGLRGVSGGLVPGGRKKDFMWKAPGQKKINKPGFPQVGGQNPRRNVT